eukprot:3600892-Lingulodinium_polyedra.AAC.1
MFQASKRAAATPQASAYRDHGVVIAPQVSATTPANKQRVRRRRGPRPRAQAVPPAVHGRVVLGDRLGRSPVARAVYVAD